MLHILYYFCGMFRSKILFVIIFLQSLCLPLAAQNAVFGNNIRPEDRQVDMDNPTFVPMVKVGKVLHGNDSIQYVELNNVYVYPPQVFKNEKARRKYTRLVYNVKKVLPIAKEVNHIIIETYEYLQTLPNKKAKDQHMKLVEAGIKKEYTPRMKKLTFSQGKLLSAHQGIPRSYPRRFLPGICLDLRRKPHQKIRPRGRRPRNGARGKTRGERTDLTLTRVLSAMRLCPS